MGKEAPEAPPERTPLTSAEQAYATTIAEEDVTLAKAFTELGELFQNPHQIGNEDWTFKMATQLPIIQTAYNKAMEMEAPDSMTHIHYKRIQALKHYNTATELIAQGIEGKINQVASIEQAGAEMQTGGQLFNEATELALEFFGLTYDPTSDQIRSKGKE